MKHTCLTVLCVVLCVLTLCSCTNVADIGKPVEGDPVTTTTTVQTTDTTAQTTTTQTTAQTTTAADEPDTKPTEAVNTTPDATEIRTPGVSYFVPKSAAVSSSYFDDAVFVGDSVSLKLMYYDIANSCLGSAAWLTSGSLGIANCMWDLNRTDAVHPSYQGQKVTVVDGIAKTGKSKVYLMLGMNDIGLYGVDGTFENFKTLTDKILAASPNVTMYIQSVTPMVSSLGGLNNDKINQYNALISEYCREKGWYFVDVASVMRDDSGYLRYSYCSDPDGMGIHFTDTACQLWVDYLYTHTAN